MLIVRAREPSSAAAPDRSRSTGWTMTDARRRPRASSVRPDLFARELARLGVRDPARVVATGGRRSASGGDARPHGRAREAIEQANAEALAGLVGGEPRLMDRRPAWEALELPERVVPHSGPPIEWGACASRCRPRCCAPSATRNGPPTTTPPGGSSRTGTSVWSRVITGARRLMTGIITRSMPVFVVENRGGATARTPPSTKVSAASCDSAPTTTASWPDCAGSPPRPDHCWAPGSVRPAVSISARSWPRRSAWAMRCISGTWRPRRCSPARSCRTSPGSAVATTRWRAWPSSSPATISSSSTSRWPPARRWPIPRRACGSTLVTTMARNGTDFGIRVSALGERWFTAPVETPVGLISGFGPADATPTWATARSSRRRPRRGDGACRRWRVSWAGGLADALATTEAMREICDTRSSGSHARRPRTPVGVDVRRVVETGVTPLINTGIAGRRAGTGQVGAGVVRAPLGCFTAALEALSGG